MSSTGRVIQFAKRNGGVFTTREALDLGLPSSTLTRRIDDGIFVRLGRGVLALPGTSTRPDALMRAAGRLLGAVVSHESAAKLHQMGPIPSTGPSVAVFHRATYDFPGLVVHQSTDLLDEHVTKVGPHRVTTPTRTLIDLAKVLRQSRLEQVTDNALAAGLVEFENVVTHFQALTRQGKSGMQKMRRILEQRADGEHTSDSVIESKLLELLDEVGLELPVKQFHAPWLEPINGRVDFAYLERRVVIEADSRRWHGLFEAFEIDRRRDIAAQLAGWKILRFTWKMLTEDPRFVIDTVRAALRTG